MQDPSDCRERERDTKSKRKKRAREKGRKIERDVVRVKKAQAR